jgi:hypothetical protein
VSVDYDHQLRCWTYYCPFGCFDYGFASAESAADVEASHDCMFARFQGGGPVP